MAIDKTNLEITKQSNKTWLLAKHTKTYNTIDANMALNRTHENVAIYRVI